MRALLSLITMGLLAAQDLPIGESRHPQPIKPFDLNYFDIRTAIYDETKMTGKVMTEFFVDENGNVVEPVIIDSFNIDFNQVILDKLRQQKYKPALQNGRPLKVKYSLPIVFK